MRAINSMAALMVLALVLAVGMASPAHADATPTAQQAKMKTCNADATSKSLKGDERKAFMKTCLSHDYEPAPKTLTPQQQKMVDCNKQAKAKTLKGADRKKFMSGCLKG